MRFIFTVFFILSTTLSNASAWTSPSSFKARWIPLFSSSSSDMNEKQKQCDVGIVGSGPSGLVLAHALIDRGYTVNIFERRDSFSPIGAAVFLHPFALNSLKNISPTVEENLRKASTEIKSIQLNSILDDKMNFRTDRLDQAANVLGSPFTAVQFWEMLKALKKGLPDDIFRFGHEVQSFEQLDDGVMIHFLRSKNETDLHGEKASCKVGILIDAGGIRSKVRKQLIGDEAIPRLKATLSLTKAKDVHKVKGLIETHQERQLFFSLGDGDSTTTTRLSNGDIWWTHAKYSDDPTRAIEKNKNLSVRENLDERFSVWPKKIRGLVDATPTEKIIESTLSELPVSFKWGKDDVTLLGDAAHALLPSLGFGVSTAFADVNELAKQIDKFGLSREALRWYEFVRIPQTAFLQILSRLAYFAYTSSNK